MRVAVALALRRLSRRRGVTALLTIALAGAGCVLGASSIVASLSQDENLRVRLSELPAAARSLQVQYRTEPGPQRGGSLDGVAGAALDDFDDVLGARRQARFWDRVSPADERGTRFVEVADLAQTVSLVAGRLPGVCRQATCEAISLDRGFLDVGDELPLSGGATVRIVGLGVLPADAVPLSITDAQTRALVVQGDLPVIRRELVTSGSLVLTSAPLEPQSVHSYSLDRLRERLRQTVVRLERTDRRLSATAPLAPLDRLARSGTVARERLLLVAGQGAALILAFAAFAATARRRDVLALRDQLETLGASGRQFLTARATEALVPAALGAVLALTALRLWLEVIAERRSLPAAFVSESLPASAVLSVLALGAIGAVLLFAMVAPERRSRFGIGALELAALTALLLIGWQTTTTSALDSSAITRGEGGGPVLLLVPALGVFAAGVLLLRLLPFGFRVAERLARGAPFGIRLALLGAARNPAQAAAATTFLAVALGTALFSLNYRATLEQQAVDAARFEAGGSWRVIERGDFGATNVSPLTRFAAVSSETPTPVLRLRAIPRETGRLAERELAVLAVPTSAIPKIGGWRDSFSDLSMIAVAERLSARRASLRGPIVPAGATAIRVWAQGRTDIPRTAELSLLLPGQRFERFPLGSLERSWRLLRARLPASLANARIIGVRFPPDEGVAGGGGVDDGNVTLGTLQVRRGSSWVDLSGFPDWATSPTPGRRSILYATEPRDAPVTRAVRLELNGGGAAFIRPKSALAQQLPALLSPEVAALAVDGVVTLDLLGRRIRVRDAGRAELFPTVVETPRRFAVLDYETLFTALNLDQPGVAPPSEAWFFGVQAADFGRGLAQPPFRLERAVSVERLEQRGRTDPLANGAADLLLLSGLAGAVLAVLGLLLAVRSDLLAERQLFAEYEALGVPPSTLARSVQYRLVTLCALGLLASVFGAALAVRLTSAFVAVTGSATNPLPPIEPAIAWIAGITMLAVVAALSVTVASRLAARSFRQSTGARLRA